MAEVFHDTGWVSLAGDPEEKKSVTWVKFPGVVVYDETYVSDEDGESAIPVSTKDLVDAGIKLTAGSEEPVFFFADLDDLQFASIADIHPTNFAPAIADPEAEKAFDREI